MNDPADAMLGFASDTIAKTTARVIETEVGKALLYPVANELGELLGTAMSIVNFYATDNLARQFKRWADSRQDRPITPDEIRRVMPLLPNASMVGDEKLQDLWTQLLESFASGSELVLPSFGQTLSQLSSLEATFLKEFWKIRMFPQWDDQLEVLFYHCQQGTLDEFERERPVPFGSHLVLRLDFKVLTSDLLRLGIVERGIHPEERQGAQEEIFQFSGYGNRFMRSVLGTLNNKLDDEEEAARVQHFG